MIRNIEMSTKGALVAFRSGAPRSAESCRTPVVPMSQEPEPAVAPLAFHSLYAQHVRFVWRSLRLLGVAPECLEDAVQDTFAVIARQLGSFEGRSTLSTWIFGIVQRVAANQRRTQRRKLASLLPLTGNVPCSEPGPQATAEATEVALAIERFCEQLSDERRRLFILALLEELPAPEIAAADGVPLNTLYSRIRSLRRELKAFLEQGDREFSSADPPSPSGVPDE
jgi:RNA polymerase sigma-70 factor (ECF subfamily)